MLYAVGSMKKCFNRSCLWCVSCVHYHDLCHLVHQLYQNERLECPIMSQVMENTQLVDCIAAFGGHCDHILLYK